MWAERFALGELGLKPWEFGILFPHEFNVMRDGFERREDRAWEKVATLGQWVLAPHTKQIPRLDKMLGRHLRTRPDGFTSEADREDAFEKADAARRLAEAQQWYDRIQKGRHGQGDDDADRDGGASASLEDGPGSGEGGGG